jgi:exonuclease III
VAQWNANGLHRHIEEIKIFLQFHHIDVLLISETHCTPRTYCNIPQYKIYHTTHPDGTAHAGTAILVRQTIRHHELRGFRKPFLQTTTIKMFLLPYELTIPCVYCPPRHNIKEQQFTEFFRKLGPKFLAGGDYNSKNKLWGSRLTTTKGRELRNAMEYNNCSFLTTATPIY